MTHKIDDALVSELVEFLRSARESRILLWPELDRLVAKLPPPVDPDIEEARKVVAATLAPESHKACNCRAEIAAGEWDSGHKMRAALAAIKRGRSLERGEPV